MNRRSLLGGSAALLAAAGTASAATVNPDAAIIADAQEFARLEAEHQAQTKIMRASIGAASDKAYAYCDEVVWPGQEAIVERLSDTRATTPAGLLAKAEVAKVWFSRGVVVSVGETFAEAAEDHEFLVMAVIEYLLAMKGGAA